MPNATWCPAEPNQLCHPARRSRSKPTCDLVAQHDTAARKALSENGQISLNSSWVLSVRFYSGARLVNGLCKLAFTIIPSPRTCVHSISSMPSPELSHYSANKFPADSSCSLIWWLSILLGLSCEFTFKTAHGKSKSYFNRAFKCLERCLCKVACLATRELGSVPGKQVFGREHKRNRWAEWQGAKRARSFRFARYSGQTRTNIPVKRAQGPVKCAGWQHQF